MTISSTTMTKIQTHQNFKTTDGHLRHEKILYNGWRTSERLLERQLSWTVRVKPRAYSNLDQISFGGIETNSTGFTVSARSVLVSRMLHLNFSLADSSKHGNNAGTEDWATYDTMVFESKFLEVMNIFARIDLQFFLCASFFETHLREQREMQKKKKLNIEAINCFLFCSN